ncbi:RNA polymerase factor sigma-54 [Enterocloster clostridioformis]|uniref:RNA polymerase factor sigma-54 n=1 Tax=Enterocloster clostridioformis TaxID=1531 RepID=UPI001F47529E|nr:RNA polymerase factor sigma-54 [Enterocloster clostridioformis]MCF2704264.1 RNA polymerase factor sigma-54 [Enterocloster clostridioformis]
MDLKLQVKQTQTLSQRMIQSAEILQMTSQELNTYINELALENPVIDIVEPPTAQEQRESIEQQEWLNSFNEENYYLYQRQNNDDDYDFKSSWNINTDDGETLQDYLWSQLITENFTDQETEIIKFMLECLDNKGYLEESIETIASYFGTDTELVEDLLSDLQSLDPSGVCARSLEECLKLQLERRNMLTPVLESIIDNCLEMVAKNQIPAIARKLRLSPAETAGYCQIIKSLNPKPGVSFSSRDQLRYIIPDVTIVKFKDHFDILLNESMYPTIELNSYYRQMNQNPESSELKEYLGNKIRQAEWVKQCVTQRGKTLMQVSRAILEHQEEFFTFGPAHLSPLRLADIAQELDIHESTVSRAVSKKYLQCSWGVYPMNYFFSRSVAVQESSGNENGAQSVTAADIKRVLREIIEEENKKKPYSDRLLGEKLAERGISISRRTVAKYREDEGIADASGRKEYV